MSIKCERGRLGVGNIKPKCKSTVYREKGGNDTKIKNPKSGMEKTRLSKKKQILSGNYLTHNNCSQYKTYVD